MKKKTVKNVLYYVVLAVLVAVFCFSAYKIYSYYAEKRESTRLNESVAREYTIRKTGQAKEEYFRCFSTMTMFIIWTIKSTAP